MEDFLKAGSPKISTLAGVKFTHNNLEEGARCLRVNGGQFTVLLGNDQVLAFFQHLLSQCKCYFVYLIIYF